MKWFTAIILAALGGVPAQGATLLSNIGPVSYQCCSFAAAALSWTQADTWSNVQIDVLMYNNGNAGDIRAGVFYLTTSLGPGTTEAAHEIGDEVVSTDIPLEQWITVFSGYILGPGTYHLVYHNAGGVPGDNLLLLFEAELASVTVYGPGVSGDLNHFEDVEAAYRPASTFDTQPDTNLIFRITGDRQVAPIPEPATGLSLAGALGLAAWWRSRQSRTA